MLLTCSESQMNLHMFQRQKFAFEPNSKCGQQEGIPLYSNRACFYDSHFTVISREGTSLSTP